MDKLPCRPTWSVGRCFFVPFSARRLFGHLWSALYFQHLLLLPSGLLQAILNFFQPRFPPPYLTRIPFTCLARHVRIKHPLRPDVYKNSLILKRMQSSKFKYRFFVQFKTTTYMKKVINHFSGMLLGYWKVLNLPTLVGLLICLNIRVHCQFKVTVGNLEPGRIFYL
jgi:hypothetical protein